jgi:hypothetical protein
MCEQAPLRKVAAEPLQRPHLIALLDPLGDRAQTEGARQLHDCVARFAVRDRLVKLSGTLIGVGIEPVQPRVLLVAVASGFDRCRPSSGRHQTRSGRYQRSSARCLARFAEAPLHRIARWSGARPEKSSAAPVPLGPAHLDPVP